LEPEILVVDEVLAVGDTAFQAKCLRKMQDVGTGGRTVLFVSHQMAAIQKLCTRCFLLSGGALQMAGATEEVVRQYVELDGNAAQASIMDRADRRGTQRLKFAKIELVVDQLLKGVLTVRLVIRNPGGARFDDVKLSVDLHNALGMHVSNLTNYVVGNPIPIDKPETRVELTVRDINLVPGRYSVSLFMATDRHNSEILDWVDDVARFDVPELDYYGTGLLPPVKSGAVLMRYQYVAR
jgi:lipopolysaccharide transport system ATP-binding protein